MRLDNLGQTLFTCDNTHNVNLRSTPLDIVEIGGEYTALRKERHMLHFG